MSSKNLLDKLLKESKIRKQDTDINYLNGLINSARQNFLSAKYNLEGNFYETAFLKPLMTAYYKYLE